ncbi:MAG: PAS domain S-box protein [Syntrophales bacterium]|nr:PAS domain S-box protein [Syntrophales bacterium]
MNNPKSIVLIALSILIFLIGLYLLSLKNYLLFHSLAELYSIVIAGGIFIVAWNARSYLDCGYLLLLGISYLFVGFIDTIHTLAFKGMGVFAGSDANLPTQLWIAARYLESFSFLAASFFIDRTLNIGKALFFYSVIVLLIFSSIVLDVFPTCYIEGYGLTPFKIGSEYAISAILLFSIYLLRRRKEMFSRRVYGLISWSIVTTIFSEIAFTLYVNVYGISNFFGHVLKIVSFYLIYKAIIETGLRKPYELLWRRMKLNEDKLREERDKIKKYMDIAAVIMLVIDAEGNVAMINKKGCEVLDYNEDEVLGKNWFDHFIPEANRVDVKRVFERIISGHQSPLSYFENPVLTRTGEERLIAWHNTFLTDEYGKIIATLSSGEDVTEKKQLEREREALIEKLERALQQVKVMSGLLPICAACKKIRGKDGKWVQIEAYVREHSDADFSHGICPDCARKIYGDLGEK